MPRIDLRGDAARAYHDPQSVWKRDYPELWEHLQRVGGETSGGHGGGGGGDGGKTRAKDPDDGGNSGYYYFITNRGAVIAVVYQWAGKGVLNIEDFVLLQAGEP